MLQSALLSLACALPLLPATPSAPPGAAPSQRTGAASPAKQMTQIPTPTRLLDGRFDDWARLDPAAMRAEKVEQLDGPDLVRGALAADDRWLWIYLEFSQPLTLQGAGASIRLLIDGDGNPGTGAAAGELPGADLAIVCSPEGSAPSTGGPPTSSGDGIEAHSVLENGSPGPTIPLESLGLGVAPSHAGKEFEFRLDRSATRFQQLTCRALVSVARAKPDGVETLDSLLPIPCLLPPATNAPLAKADAESVAKTSGTTVRVASWNAELGAIFKHPAGFASTLKSIGPDIILFQELGKAKPEELLEWLNTHLPGESPWQVAMSGGDLRTAVAARASVRPAPFLDGLKRSTPKGDRDVRAAGAIIEHAGGRLLAVSLHLKCCGRLASSEDETREAEAKAIHDAIRDALAKAKEFGQPIDGVVVGGDFNLVGTPDVLTYLSGGLDLDGTNLDVVDAMQLDGTSNTTWRDTGGRFAPGRLDWLLASGATLRLLRAFVFSEEDLSSEAASTLGLAPEALSQPSDHQPLVADFAFQAPALPKDSR